MKKYLNWLNSTMGMNEYHVYLQLLITFEMRRFPVLRFVSR